MRLVLEGAICLRRLRRLKIDRPNRVWRPNITYAPMPQGHACLCAVMDWRSPKVLGWAVSNTVDTGLCLRTLEEAPANAGGAPETFNAD